MKIFVMQRWTLHCFSQYPFCDVRRKLIRISRAPSGLDCTERESGLHVSGTCAFYFVHFRAFWAIMILGAFTTF